MMTEEKKLPWIEKFRPNKLDEIIDHQNKIQTLKSLISKNELTHLIFYGSPGSGKTSTILACAKEMYGIEYKKYILELNASDDRGIETVRKSIPDFVKSSSNKVKLVILDEADAMTYDAQSALRRVIEMYSKNSRFCLICNDINKIIPGLQSRCTKMNFGSLSPVQIKIKVSEIIEKEGIKISDKAVERLININRDFRQILNTLQCLHSINTEIIEPDDINKYLGIPTDEDIVQIINKMSELSFKDSCAMVYNEFKSNQWSLTDFINRTSKFILESECSDDDKISIIKKLSDIDYKLICSDSEIQLYAFVSAFK